MPVDQQVRIAHGVHRGARKQRVGHLGLLQAEQVRLRLGGEAGQVVEALAQRVDVPGGEPDGHGRHLGGETRFRRDTPGTRDLPYRFSAGFVLVRPLCYHCRQPREAIWGIPAKEVD